MANNRIPRNFNHIIMRDKTGGSGSKPGDIWTITKDYSGYHGINHRTHKTYSMFVSWLRCADVFEIISIV